MSDLEAGDLVPAWWQLTFISVSPATQLAEDVLIELFIFRQAQERKQRLHQEISASLAILQLAALITPPAPPPPLITPPVAPDGGVIPEP